MATVPHTPAPCEQLTTLIAECFGDQPTPAPQRPANDHTAGERWQDAVTQVGEQLRAKLRVEALPERLHKALVLVLAHAVTLHPDGTASVQSGTQTYRLAPECPCADATHRAELCKHALAVELHRRALTRLDGTAAAPSASPLEAAATPPAAASTRASATWDVHEAPVSSCFKIRVGALEWTHTIRGSEDAELQTRLQAFLPTFRDIASALEAMQAEREAAKAAPAPPAAQPMIAPADLRALIQQAVQHALAAQAAARIAEQRHGSQRRGASKPGRLVRPASGRDGTAQQRQGGVAQPLVGERTALLQGQVAVQRCGGRESSAPA